MLHHNFAPTIYGNVKSVFGLILGKSKFGNLNDNFFPSIE